MTEQYSLVETAPEPPYPAEVSAKGWRLELDVDRLRKSDTWALAQVAGPAYRPWLLMLWVTAWDQDPCGTFPNDDQLIAVRIGLDVATFAAMRHILMRGWRLHADGRLYHDTLTAVVQAMLEAREKERTRKARNRAKAAAEQEEKVSRGTTKGRTRKSRQKDATGTGTSTGSNTDSAAAPLVSLADLIQAGVHEEDAASWLQVRKKKDAPLTITAWKGVLSEAEKAGMTPAQAVQRSARENWAGFKASWLDEDQGRRSGGRPAGHQPEAIGTPDATQSQQILEHLSRQGTRAPEALRSRLRRPVPESTE